MTISLKKCDSFSYIIPNSICPDAITAKRSKSIFSLVVGSSLQSRHQRFSASIGKGKRNNKVVSTVLLANFGYRIEVHGTL